MFVKFTADDYFPLTTSCIFVPLSVVVTFFLLFFVLVGNSRNLACLLGCSLVICTGFSVIFSAFVVVSTVAFCVLVFLLDFVYFCPAFCDYSAGREQ